MDRVFIVIPAYNEASAIGSVAASLRERGYEMVVVDDASQDATAAVAAAHGAHLVMHPVNRGQGAALASGIRFALELGATHIATFDADGQHDSDDIARLLAMLKARKADIAFGSRFLGRAIGLGRRRRFLLHCSAWFSWATTGLRLSDTQNGLRVMTAEAAGRIRISQNRYAHALEIIAEAARLRLRYVEVASTVTYTEYSRGKGQSLWSGAGILKDLSLAWLKA